MTDPTEAMQEAARALYRPDGCEPDSYEERDIQAFSEGMAHAAELIGAMVKVAEDQPVFVIKSGVPLPPGEPLGDQAKLEAEIWKAQLAEAEKNAPSPLSERIANGEWLK